MDVLQPTSGVDELQILAGASIPLIISLSRIYASWFAMCLSVGVYRMTNAYKSCMKVMVCKLLPVLGEPELPMVLELFKGCHY